MNSRDWRQATPMLRYSSSNFIPNLIQQYNTVCMANIANNRVIIDIVMWFCWWPPEKPWAYQAGSHTLLKYFNDVLFKIDFNPWNISLPCFISGIEGELCYVRNDAINRYAMTYNMPIKEGIHDLYFTWQNLLTPPEPPVRYPLYIFFYLTMTSHGFHDMWNHHWFDCLFNRSFIWVLIRLGQVTNWFYLQCHHTSVMSHQITSNSTLCSTPCSGIQQRNINALYYLPFLGQYTTTGPKEPVICKRVFVSRRYIDLFSE